MLKYFKGLCKAIKAYHTKFFDIDLIIDVVTRACATNMPQIEIVSACEYEVYNSLEIVFYIDEESVSDIEEVELLKWFEFLRLKIVREYNIPIKFLKA